MTDRETMKLALDALEINLPIAYAKNGRGERFPCFSDDPLREIKTREAITALRQTLEQPKREWVGLTDEEEIELDEKYGDDFNAYIDARDAKLKEKNHD